ncbi:hypothetical protein KZ309_25850, partial [Escherichia coli]|nr:hypothetical protein [Escherichia coli]
VYMSIKDRDARRAVEVLNEAMSGNITAIEQIKSIDTAKTKELPAANSTGETDQQAPPNK